MLFKKYESINGQIQIDYLLSVFLILCHALIGGKCFLSFFAPKRIFLSFRLLSHCPKMQPFHRARATETTKLFVVLVPISSLVYLQYTTAQSSYTHSDQTVTILIKQFCGQKTEIDYRKFEKLPILVISHISESYQICALFTMKFIFTGKQLNPFLNPHKD